METAEATRRRIASCFTAVGWRCFPRSTGGPRYLSRHPYRADSIRAPTTRLLGIRVERYLLVEHFQQAIELRVQP